MNKLKIVLIGDSITDAGRDYRNYHNMGNGYAKYVKEILSDMHPDCEFEFINFGISGNRTSQLFDRLYTDCIAFAPDIVSILIGVNDVWHRFLPAPIRTTTAQTELNLRCILERIKAETNAKIIVMQPYVLNCEDNDLKRELPEVRDVVERLASEYADAYIPLQNLFDNALVNEADPMFFSLDGVHPNQNGACFIAKHYADCAKVLINGIIKNKEI